THVQSVRRTSMFIAMNRFKVAAGSEEAFEALWKNRDSSLAEMPGFVGFHLLRGPRNAEEGYTLYASPPLWKTQDDFAAWTRSENFRKAHRSAGKNKNLYEGPSLCEGFAVVEGARSFTARLQPVAYPSCPICVKCTANPNFSIKRYQPITMW